MSSGYIIILSDRLLSCLQEELSVEADGAMISLGAWSLGIHSSNTNTVNLWWCATGIRLGCLAWILVMAIAEF